MLLKVNTRTQTAERVVGEKLRTFGISERDLQNILFDSLDRLLYEDELLIIMQSRHWQEEPDLMAIDKVGRLYIFELKAWESRSENLLQVLRYGQRFGNYKYDDLQILFNVFDEIKRCLRQAHRKADAYNGVKHRFMGTMFALDTQSGKKLRNHINDVQGEVVINSGGDHDNS